MTRFAPSRSEPWPTRQLFKQQRDRPAGAPHTGGGELERTPVRKAPLDDEPTVYDCIQANLAGSGDGNA